MAQAFATHFYFARKTDMIVFCGADVFILGPVKTLCPCQDTVPWHQKKCCSHTVVPRTTFLLYTIVLLIVSPPQLQITGKHGTDGILCRQVPVPRWQVPEYYLRRECPYPVLCSSFCTGTTKMLRSHWCPCPTQKPSLDVALEVFLHPQGKSSCSSVEAGVNPTSTPIVIWASCRVNSNGPFTLASFAAILEAISSAI